MPLSLNCARDKLKFKLSRNIHSAKWSDTLELQNFPLRSFCIDRPMPPFSLEKRWKKDGYLHAAPLECSLQIADMEDLRPIHFFGLTELSFPSPDEINRTSPYEDIGLIEIYDSDLLYALGQNDGARLFSELADRTIQHGRISLLRLRFAAISNKTA